MSIGYNLPNLLQLHGNMYDFSSFELKAELSIFHHNLSSIVL